LTKYPALIQSTLKRGCTRDEDGSLFLQITKFKLKDKLYILGQSTHIPQLNKIIIFFTCRQVSDFH